MMAAFLAALAALYPLVRRPDTPSEGALQRDLFREPRPCNQISGGRSLLC
jgi:hypothetical protein